MDKIKNMSEGKKWAIAIFSLLFALVAVGVIGDQEKFYLEHNGVGNNVKTWNDAVVIEKSTGQDFIIKENKEE